MLLEGIFNRLHNHHNQSKESEAKVVSQTKLFGSCLKLSKRNSVNSKFGIDLLNPTDCSAKTAWCQLGVWSGRYNVTWYTPRNSLKLELPPANNDQPGAPKSWISVHHDIDKNQIILTNHSSEHSVFVSSPTLTQNALISSWPIVKIEANSQLAGFDFNAFEDQLLIRDSNYNFIKKPGQLDLEKTPVILVSPKKGWGNGYKRLTFLECEFRYEIWLNIRGENNMSCHEYN